MSQITYGLYVINLCTLAFPSCSGDVSLPSGLLVWQTRQLPSVTQLSSHSAGLVGFAFCCLLPYKTERAERRKAKKEGANLFIACVFLIAITFFFFFLEIIMNHEYYCKYLDKWNGEFEFYPRVLSYLRTMLMGGDNYSLLFTDHYAVVLLA